MKNLSLLFIAFLLIQFTAYAQDDWFWVNPSPQGNDLKDVFVIDENTIFAVGDRGTLLRSDNGGVDWEITHRLLDISENIVDVEFVSEQKGYLLANKYLKNDFYHWIHYSSKILVTEDSGMNWKVIADFDSLKLNDLFFIDENVGWVIGVAAEYGMILKTTNGGYDWDTIQMDNSASSGFSIIQFIDSKNGWAAGKYTELLKTTDGGFNWNLVYDPAWVVIISFQFLNQSDGWLIELNAGWGNPSCSIKRTVDGGLNWEVISFTGESDNYGISFPSLYFINPDTGWVKEDNIHKTTDGGLNWITATMNTPSDGATHFSDGLNGCIVGNSGGIITTQDGGQSWSERSAMTIGNDLLAVDFCDDKFGWATALGYTIDFEFTYLDGIIYSTSNGGSSWAPQLYIGGGRNYDGIINDVQAINDQIVYGVGRKVYKTTNSGTNWITLENLEASIYKSLFFINEETGFVGSAESGWGKIYGTTNGGLDWDTVLSVQDHTVESILFADVSVGWALVKKPFESESHIYRTNDTGENWQEIAVQNLDLNSIYFANENVGLAVGCHDVFALENYGVIIRTTDGGYNWDEIYSMDCYDFKSVYFIDSGKAIVVGREGVWPYYSDNFYGIILSVNDVGENFNIEQQSWTRGLNDIYFINNTGWAVGDGGTIIKTEGGVSFVEEEEIAEIPTDYNLTNNYPNPFNPSTSIRYSIPQSTNVIIKVFDILGNEIETLVNEEKPIGTYEITWYAENLPSGVYFYRLQVYAPGRTGSFVETKKMVLLR